MPWPIATGYQEAVQNPRLCFSDADLNAGTARVDRFGVPLPISGAFATVYQVDTPTGHWAVRCFLTHVEDTERRYAAISDHLRQVRLNSAVAFEFLPKGIRVQGQWYPILKMEWINGEPLNAYVANNLGQPQRLLELARGWSEMMASLRTAQIAHGDLQHGNVLVTPSGLRLIDYDGMFVPSLNGCTSHENGHRNYQHPKRSGHDFGPYLDNFSAWGIFCSVMCVALEPRLWNVLDGGDECLLFRREDFERPERSRAFQVLESSRPEVKALAGQFRALISMPLRQIPALDGRIAAQPAATPNRATTGGAIPDWLAGHVTPARQQPAPREVVLPVDEESPAVVPTADWIIDHLVDRQLPVPTFGTHSFAVERLALLLTLCATATTGWCARVYRLPLASTLVIVVVMVGACAVLFVARHRQATGQKERRQAAASLRRARESLQQYRVGIRLAELRRTNLLAPLDALEAQFRDLPRKLNEELRGLQSQLDAVRGSFAGRRQGLAREEAQAIQVVEQEARRELMPLQAEKSALDQKERDELAKALAAAQEAHVNSRLANATIDDLAVSGIGPKLKARLRANGTYSAWNVNQQNVRNVEGIGDAKARQLLAWKDEIIRHANVPSALPQAQAFQIRNQFVLWRQVLERRIDTIEETERGRRQGVLDRYARARAAIDREEHQATATHESSVQALHAKLQRERVRVDTAFRALKARLAPERNEHDQTIGDLNRRMHQQRFEVCKLERELERYKGLSPRRYAGRIVGFRRAA